MAKSTGLTASSPSFCRAFVRVSRSQKNSSLNDTNEETIESLLLAVFDPADQAIADQSDEEINTMAKNSI